MAPSEYFFEENCYITELLNDPADPLVSVARVRVLPGESTKWHLLEGIVERYLILDGTGLAEVGDRVEKVQAPDNVIIPPGVRQRITNKGTVDLIFLAVCTPRFVEAKYRSLE
jgi:mannose-6-phosphate isomerase-like protein (cupin superfamily)